MKHTITIAFIIFSIQLAYSQDFKKYKTLNGHREPVTHINFRSEDNLLSSGDKSGKIIIWNTETGEIQKVLHEHDDKITDIAFSNSGELMASASYDGKIKIWKLSNWQEIKSFDSPTNYPFSGMNGNEPAFVIFSENDTHIIYGGYNMKIYKTNINSGQTTELYSTSKGAITCATLTDNKQKIIFGAVDKIFVMNLQNNRIEKEISKSSQYDDMVCETELLPNSNELAYWAYNGKIHFYDLQTGNLTKSISATAKKGTSNIAFSFDKKFMLTGNDNNKTKIWNLENGQVVQTLEGHTQEVTCFAYSQDGNYIVTGSNDKNIIVWKKEQNQTSDDDIVYNNNIPETMQGRTVEIHQTTEVNNSEIEFLVWDRSQIDGDIISLNVNGEWILREYELKREKKSVNVKLTQTDNYLIMFAHNEGRIPPNTAAISVKDGRREIVLSLKSTLNSCGTLNLKYIP